jgi:hypothetical protein
VDDAARPEVLGRPYGIRALGQGVVGAIDGTCVAEQFWDGGDDNIALYDGKWRVTVAFGGKVGHCLVYASFCCVRSCRVERDFDGREVCVYGFC